ncbi:phage/plasmid replication protein, II/X family [Roseateles puraquae]|uniref:Replication-associated protein G2P N-terminal domain-containing protein n=1 Tax=Roseateles puraquae TaxID=431059 RepID=A0A254N9B3_9BURK|nr:phage/plasmid replication protein, II/X family [Roseateles puraquae]MDG0853369.1 hypothetical protein [Roseateles puraquae]OWR02947.1 hypothetical protein CDO81_15280 [Roseateles puraquae]
MTTPLIDTAKVRVAVNHQPWLERQIEAYRAGQRSSVNRALASNYRRFSVPGAYGASASVQSILGGTALVIECSLPRFLTGQNVFGSIQILPQVVQVVDAVLSYLNIVPTDDESTAIAEGRIGLNRVDITAHARLGNETRVRRMIKALKATLAFTKANFSCYGDETLYIGQNSDYKTLKLYDKAGEIAAHPLPANHPQRELVSEAVRGLLRVELCLRRRFLLERGWTEVRLFDAKAARRLLVSELKALTIKHTGAPSTQIFEPSATLSSLDNSLVAAHLAGVDVQDLLPSRRQLNAHRQTIAAATAIDILVPVAASRRISSVDPTMIRNNLVRRFDERAVGLREALGVQPAEARANGVAAAD